MAVDCGKTVEGTKRHNCIGRYVLSFERGNRVILHEKDNLDGGDQDASVDGAIRAGVNVCADCPARRLVEPPTTSLVN